MFEVKNYEQHTIQLDEYKINKDRNHWYKQHFRNWFLVPSADLKNAKIKEMEDDNGKFFISSTQHYIPIWLRADGEMTNIPQDEKVPSPALNE